MVAARAMVERKTGRAAIIAGGDAPPVLQPAEHDFDPVSPLVAALVVTDGVGPGFAARDAGRDALGLQGVPEPVRIIAPITEQPLSSGKTVQEGGGAGVVADLASGHEQADGASVGIGHGMKLGVHAALGASDQPPEAPFFTRRLEAVRCALRYVASIMTVRRSA